MFTDVNKMERDMQNFAAFDSIVSFSVSITLMLKS
jgi:hypothetical protein